MITVKGFIYYSDFNMPAFEKKFENLGQLLYFIKNNTLGKSRILFPAVTKDGKFNQNFASTFSAHLRYESEQRSDRCNAETHLTLIKDEDDKILFSSGEYTDSVGHISSAMKQMLDDLKSWSEAPYEFAD